MECKPVARVVLASVAIGALLGSPQLMAECFPVKGKIFNTLHSPPLGGGTLKEESCSPPPPEDPLYYYEGGVSTLGVVTFNGGAKFGKMKCAIAGEVDEYKSTFVCGDWPTLSSFFHTLSCDDDVPDLELGGLTRHSQLTFHTTGEVTDFTGSTFAFIEHSIPVQGSGFGAFAGVTDGVTDGGEELTIIGTTNLITGNIDMVFTGKICTTE